MSIDQALLPAVWHRFPGVFMVMVSRGESPTLVLVVDDEPSVRITLSLCLQAAGYATICAADGQAAQQMVDDFSPSAIVADIFMPVQDGLGLMNWLREQGRRIPVIAIS